MRILFVEDDADLGFGVQLALQKMSYQVDHVDNGIKADQMLLVQLYDLVILDIGLPGISGLDVLRRLRLRKSKVPVLVLTARDHVADRVSGLDAGADDYLVKPFAMTELEARARALMRRGGGGSSVFEYDILRIDTVARTVFAGDTLLKQAPREFILLELFMHNQGTVLNKKDLIERFSGSGSELGENAIEVSIFRLRKKLEPHGIRLKTVRNAGYLLEAEGGDSPAI